MKKTYTFFLILVSISTLSYLIGKSFRVENIPHGSENACANCHTNPAGGGERNSFGIAAAALIPAGEEFWSPEFAALDSDGDGFTNGQELQDPNGTWVKGTDFPGDATAVTNPGDPNDHPPVTSVDKNADIADEFRLYNNYPNPFNPTTTISFNISENADVTLDIYNSVGELVTRLVDQNFAKGKYTSLWNGRNDFGNKVNSGIYFYKFTANNYSNTKRMMLLK